MDQPDHACRPDALLFAVGELPRVSERLACNPDTPAQAPDKRLYERLDATRPTVLAAVAALSITSLTG
ncbi:hypothetical protein ABFA25_01925 [Mycobacterium lepromatosis]|uniref:hypothetical protein n=1 Tax=Mycobacterium lepromatosis TaxID=480418 RepID=UPI000A73DFE9